ncbi:MAG: hypothetical protein ABI895_36870 [Deltaproteobacteria bacterium]
MQWRFSRGWALLAAWVLWSCQPEIGDSCANASDCSQQGERTCDTTLPGGYCTKFGCSADSCPSEAACIGYQTLVSIAPECASLQVRPRLQRTACMLSCAKDGDCRSGYVCVDMAQTNPWGALLIDRSGSGKVCTLPPPAAAVGETGVCQSQPAPAERPPVPTLPSLDAGADAD